MTSSGNEMTRSGDGVPSGHHRVSKLVTPSGGIADYASPARRTAADAQRPDDTERLRIARWAYSGQHTAGEDFALFVRSGPRSIRVPHSRATGDPLMTNGHIGVDLIRLEAGDGFVPHTHPGDHLLIVVGGSGTITFGGRIYPTSAGEVYLIAGLVPHAVGAITEHVLLAVGAPYKPLASPDRMTPEHYEAVTTALGDLECQICHLTATYPSRPHELDCPHCPCADCVGQE